MRPRSLTLRGFRSYADEVRFDFTGRNLVGIVGPIGSGKSSILDAVSFALYGKTPKFESETKRLINQRRAALHVELVFEVDGVVWKVVRVLRRTGAAAHTLYRIPEGAEPEEVADKAREVTERIEALLGLEFEAFRRSVLLAQNQFAGFLEAPPTDRSRVLKGVFGFDRLDAMREVVKGRLDVIGRSLQHLAARRASAEADRRLLETRSVELAAAEARATTLDALRESVMQADALIRQAEGDMQAADEELRRLDDLGARIPTHPDTVGLFDAASTAAAGVAAAEASHQAALAAVAKAVGEVEEAFAAAGGRDAVQQAGDAVARLEAARVALADLTERRDRLARDRVAAAEGHDAALAEVTRAEEAASRATAEALAAAEAAEQARVALHRAHEADRAAGLRSTLVPGEPCPVCAQTVAVVPPPAAGSQVAAADAELKRRLAAADAPRAAEGAAAGTRGCAQARLTAGAARLDELARECAAADEQVRAAEDAVARLDASVRAVLGDGDPVEALRSLRARVAAAERATETARAAELGARRTRDEALAARDQTVQAVQRLRTTVATLAGRLGVELELAADEGDVAAGLQTLRAEWLQRRDATATARQRSARQADTGRAARVDLLESAGLAATDDIVEITTEAFRAATALGAEVRVLERNLAELDELAAEEATALAGRELLDRLHADLAPSKFLEYVLDERRRVLADLAGTHLETLTAGRYRFSDDGEFDVIDLAAADLVRSAASLSGGETFLASLALALALAEIVSREGGRLDAFFLDEGFGSLDPEHLDLAMDGVERLVASGGDRLVVVVSHVPALRERFEDLIVLDRDAVTGVTRVVGGAGGEP
ncbi:MAG: SMC family ATPase [Acidimicrobiia bacterium]|nr:SMC family ATPase [Acidimicrobiia bacterium]